VRPGIAQDVRVLRDGYEPRQREVSVAPGGRELVEFTLEPILGQVIVSARPADAQLVVDGTPRGNANQTLELTATEHTLEIRRSGYATHRVTVTPRPGLPQSIDVTLLEGVARAPSPAAAAAGAGSPPAGTEAPAVVALQPTLRSPAGQELRLVPAGEYTMGSPRREAGRRANESQRAVRLERRFYLGAREVTNGEFRQFRPSHRSGYVLQDTLDLDRQPVVGVSWQEAAEFCNWLSAKEGLAPAYVNQGGRLVPASPMTNGYRLPTEAEWEWAARGVGGPLRKYPWGDTLPVPPGAGNYADAKAQPLVEAVIPGYDDGYAVTAPVGSFAPGPAGFHDLGGNVAEWTHDLYTVQPASGAAAVDPVAGGAGALHVIRGSSWRSAAVTELRLAYRDFGDGKRNDLGFRIARYAQ
jgi:formylglycine-generating enzyme required for sulfatase activity